MNTKSVAERLEEVRAKIARIKEITGDEHVSISPNCFKEMPVAEFAELMDLLPDAKPERGYLGYRVYATVDGMRIWADSEAVKDKPAVDVREELKAYRNKAA